MPRRRPLSRRIAGRLTYWRLRAVQLYRLYGPKPQDLDTGSRAYRAHAREEIEHYGALFSAEGNAGERARETLLEPAPDAWGYIHERVAARMSEATGRDLTEHLAARMSSAPGRALLSLGCGPGGVELLVAERAPQGTYRCLDLNPGLLALGRERARRQSLPVLFEEADLNTVVLPEAAYDVVFCHASLHHVLKLERLATEIRRTLKPGGELVVVDIATRNGYRMWPENREWVHRIWSALPEQFRRNHTAYPEPRIDRRIWEVDTRTQGMECMRAEDVLPVLDAHFERAAFVPHSGLARRFFDSMYGPNYDLNRPLDKATIDWIWALDCDLVDRGAIRPETFFAVFRATGT